MNLFEIIVTVNVNTERAKLISEECEEINDFTQNKTF